jgi:BirA family transcriptional regulator, biotin operon repressor / biotin---[acetyl-CoA-carboxylase] ligase
LFKIPVSTLFIGKNLVDLPECDSTNTYAANLTAKDNPPEGTVVITSRQFLGRGQRGNTWETQAGTNLTFSIILYPRFLEPANHFTLSQAVSLALWDFLTGLGVADVAIKWPNDIMVDEKKICGILIENQVRGQLFSQSIVGIGLNVNQVDFTVPLATSVRLVTGKPHDLNWVLAELLKQIEVRYMQAKQHPARLGREYLDYLFWKGEPHQFQSNGNTFSGVIEGVDKSGRLRVRQDDSQLSTFAAREIIYVR